MKLQLILAAGLSLAAPLAFAGATSDLIFADDFEETVSGGSFTVGGTITLASPGFNTLCCLANPDGFCIEMQNNGGDDILDYADTEFTFETPLSTGESYDVTVTQEPRIFPMAGCTGGVQLSCSVTNGSGTIGMANVTNVQVSCN